MANIGNLVDRTYREYLEPMDDIVSYTTLTGAIDSSATSVAYNGDLLSVEEEDALDAGAIIEIGQELMICTDLNAVANTITCLLYTSPSPRDLSTSRMPSSA